MTSGPAMRGAYYRALVSALPRLGEPGRAALRARPEATEAARAGGEWAPVSLAIALAGELLAVGGAGAVRRWAHDGCIEAIQDESFRPFAERARLLGGCSPLALLGQACAAARMHLRGCGDFVLVDEAEDGASIVELPLTPELRVEPYVELIAGMIQAFPVACGLEAQVRVRAGALLDRAHFDVGWWVPGALER